MTLTLDAQVADPHDKGTPAPPGEDGAGAAEMTSAYWATL
jgi:hypothetical protein